MVNVSNFLALAATQGQEEQVATRSSLAQADEDKDSGEGHGASNDMSLDVLSVRNTVLMA